MRLALLALLIAGSACAQVNQNSIARQIGWGSSFPAKCSPTIGDIFFLTASGPTGTPYYCSGPNVWTAWSGPSGTGLSNGTFSFSSVSSVTLPGQGTASVLVACYDNASPANQMFFSLLTVGQTSPYNVTVTFSSAQSGYCVLNSAGGITSASQFNTNGAGNGTIILTSSGTLAQSTFSVPTNLVAGASLDVNPQDSGGTGYYETTITSCGVMDYTCVPIREEFQNTSNTAQQIGAYGWDLNLIGATGCTASNLAAYPPNLGILHLATSATAARGCVLELDGASGTVALGNIFLTPFQSWWIAALNQIVTTPQFRIGFISGAAAAAKPGGGGAYFCFDVAGCGSDTTHWNACSNNSGTETCTSIGVIPEAIAVTGATNATPIVVSVASTANLALNTNVVITGVGGNTNANGLCHITVLVTNTSFTCGNLAGNSGYTSGGFVTPFYRFSISQAGSGIASFALYVNGTQVGSTVTICASGCTATASLYTSLTPGMTLANGATAEADNAYVDAFSFLATGMVR